MSWTLASQILSLVVLAVMAVLDYLWSDKTTPRYNLARWGLFVLIVALLIVGSVAGYRDARDRSQEANALRDDIAKLRKDSARTAEEVKAETGTIRNFLQTHYPGLSTDAALKRLEHDIKQRFGDVLNQLRRREFRPLPTSAMTEFVACLRRMKARDPARYFSVTIRAFRDESDELTINRLRVAEELLRAFALAEIPQSIRIVPLWLPRRPPWDPSNEPASVADELRRRKHDEELKTPGISFAELNREPAQRVAACLRPLLSHSIPVAAKPSAGLPQWELDDIVITLGRLIEFDNSGRLSLRR